MNLKELETALAHARAGGIADDDTEILVTTTHPGAQPAMGMLAGKLHVPEYGGEFMALILGDTYAIERQQKLNGVSKFDVDNEKVH